MMTTPEIVIHVGLPKAASTFLQETVFPNIGNVHYLGKHLALRDKLGRAYTQEAIDTFVHALQQESIAYRPEDQKTLFEKDILPSLDRTRPNLLSEESFSDGATDRGLVARRCLDAIGPVRFLITIRRQQDMVESMYSDSVKRLAHERKRYLPLPEWLDEQWGRLHGNWFENSELIRLQFYDLISYYSRLGGKENVGVLVFWEIREDPRQFARRLADFFDADANEIEGLVQRPPPQNANARLTRSQFLAAVATSRLSLSRSVSNYVPRPIKSFVKTVLVHDKNGVVSMPPEWSEKIASLCRKGNARLAAEWDLPLERYAYSL